MAATALSALSVIGGLAWLSFAPQKPAPERVLVESRNGPPACGDLHTGPPGFIGVERAGGDTQLIRLDRAEAIRRVPKC